MKKAYYIIIPLVGLIGIFGSMSAYYLGIIDYTQLNQPAQVIQPIITQPDTASSIATSTINTLQEPITPIQEEPEIESAGFLDKTYEAFPAPFAASLIIDTNADDE